MKVSPHKSSVGLDANIWALLVYIITIALGWIPYVSFVAWLFPMIIFMTEKESDFVKFHAAQSMAIYIVNAALSILFTIIIAAVGASAIFSPMSAFGAVGGIVAASAIWTILRVLLMVVTILAMIKAYQYEAYKIPVVGTLTDKLYGALNKK